MAENAGFDLASVLGNVSKLDTGTGREQIEYIDIDRIRADKNNFYKLSDIPELASNIEVCGLQQPLRVRGTADGDRVVLVSGHRRLEALRMLVKDGKEQYRSVPCIRETDEASPAMQELRLIFANSASRQLTSPELSRQAERVEALLYQLKSEGVAFPGRMRDQVAAACKTSATKLARLKVIRDHLIPEYKELFDNGKMVETTAYAMAELPTEMQQRCAKTVNPKNIHYPDQLISAVNAGCSYVPSFKCPDGKPCTHGDAFLRHDLECGYERCKGKTCCLKCDRAFYSYSSCDNACSKAKAKRKSDADQQKEKDKRASEKKASKNQINVDRISCYWQRMKQAAEEHGIKFDGKLLAQFSDQYKYSADGEIRMSRGEYKANSYDDGSREVPNADLILAFCATVGVPVSYILGIDDAPSSYAPVWRTDRKYPDGWLVAVFQMDASAPIMRKFVYSWREKLYFDESFRASIDDIAPLAWYVAPGLPEDLLKATP